MKTGPNAPCPCGSGRKYKKCCGKTSSTARHAFPREAAPSLGTGICAFSCTGNCSEWCCGGATLLTIDEVRQYHDVFPITVGFRKHTPLDEEHRDLLSAVGMPTGRQYIVGDFIAGDRYRSRCIALDRDRRCRLHKRGRKPAQCRLVPFGALYPEAKQGALFSFQRTGKFSRCEGFRHPDAVQCVVWRDGKFTDPSYGGAYHEYQRGLLKQRTLMEEILRGLRDQESYREFLGGDGILETAIPLGVFLEVLEMAGLTEEEYPLFLNNQARLCREGLTGDGTENPVLADYRSGLNDLAAAYADYLRERERPDSAEGGLQEDDQNQGKEGMT